MTNNTQNEHLLQPIHISQLVETLKQTHSVNMVHRDVRCANIMWVSDMDVLLNDWGTAYDLSMENRCFSPNALNDMYQNTNTPKFSDDLHSLVRTLYRMTHNKKTQNM